MNITVVGTGFVGVVSAAVYASLGHTVQGLDIDNERIALLKKSVVPFFEPELEELLRKQQQVGNLSFTTSYQDAIPSADLVIIAVGTPSSENGAVDLRFVESVIDECAPLIKDAAIIAVKSTVPPGTFKQLTERMNHKNHSRYHLASLPEFLKEGSAVQDSLHPDRVVIGTTDSHVAKVLKELHQPLNAPMLVVSPESAQMGKYAANAYLATRITFINEVANLCEQYSANIEEVISVFGHDTRIGMHYWYPGFGYGGSCFPKDVKELAHLSSDSGLRDDLFTFITQKNTQRIPQLIKDYQSKIGDFKGKKVAVLGLSFKPQTNDTRESPALHVVPLLLKKGAKISGYDPKATIKNEIKDINYTECTSIEEAISDAAVVFALIEWPEIVQYDFAQVRKEKNAFFIDARNQFKPEVIEKAGYTYIGVGRS